MKQSSTKKQLICCLSEIQIELGVLYFYLLNGATLHRTPLRGGVPALAGNSAQAGVPVPRTAPGYGYFPPGTRTQE